VRIYNLLAAPAVRGRARAPAVLPIVEGVLDAGCLISSLSSIAIDPGEAAQPIHADDMVIPLDSRTFRSCAIRCGVDRFHRRNGATRLVPPAI